MNASKKIHIVQLYARDMNIYGDNGNILTIERRLQWYDYEPVVHHYNPGDPFPEEADIVIGGGGQDSGQSRIQKDLQKIAPRIRELAEKDTPMLVICGLYQLFGNFFTTHDGMQIPGIGIFDMKTYGKEERLTGNCITHSEEFGDIIGYENHSGQTFLEDGVTPLATVRLGAGNNLEDSHEGARYRNVIGSYLHGSLLPKNPAIADYLIRHAVTNRYGIFSATPIDDMLTERARKQAMKRPR
jgi:hypothetical protein